MATPFTVGSGKEYASITLAYNAASAGDTIEVYSDADNIYDEALTVAKANLTIKGMVANRGIT